MHFYMASRVGWEHLSNVFHLSQKFIIRFFHLVNRLVLLHLIYSSFNKFITLYSRNIFQPSEKEPSIAIQSTLKKRSYKSLYNFSINANHRFTNHLQLPFHPSSNRTIDRNLRKKRSNLINQPLNLTNNNRWKFRMARIATLESPSPSVAVTLGHGKDAALDDAIASPLYACAHWKPMHITLKAITSPRRPVIIASLACTRGKHAWIAL